MLNHLSPKKLRPGKRTLALWARKKPSTLVVFVHGFGGDGIDTWLNFPNLLLTAPKGGKCDLIFYDYDSLQARAAASAGLLEQFLSKLLFNPANFINESADGRLRPANFRYRKILIVAHSLGAIVSRLALLRARRANLTWVRSAKLVLYAPAHTGASALDLAMTMLVGINSNFGAAAVPAPLLFQFQSLQDLSTGCPTLLRLESDTEELLADPGNKFLIARKVVLGEFDRIVNPDAFLDDPNPIVIPELDHSEVCKPPRDTSAAMIELLKVIP